MDVFSYVLWKALKQLVLAEVELEKKYLICFFIFVENSVQSPRIYEPGLLTRNELNTGANSSGLRINDNESNISPRRAMISLRELKFHYTLAVGRQGSAILADWKNMKVVVKKLRVSDSTTKSERTILTRELSAWMYCVIESNIL